MRVLSKRRLRVERVGRLAPASRGHYRPLVPLKLLPRPTPRQARHAAGLALLVAALVTAFVFRGDFLLASLNPKVPFQTYQPPKAPDYSRPGAWALLPPDPAGWPKVGDGTAGPADVFFIHPTTYDGGEEWNGPIDHPRSMRELDKVMLPNYAGPFERLGRVFAPRYRQASLYAMLTLGEDSRAARQLAYEDVRAAFHQWRARFDLGRPLIIAGVEQGAALADRLAREEAGPDPSLADRLVAVYAMRAVLPADAHAPGSVLPACAARHQARCLVAYMPVRRGDDGLARRVLARALVFGPGGELRPLGARAALCVDPLTGSAAPASERAHRGAANATNLEWGVRPAFLPHQVSAECRRGLLRFSRPKSPSLKPVGGWLARHKAPGFSLFYADIGADAKARLDALEATPGFHMPAAPITTSIDVPRARVMGR